MLRYWTLLLGLGLVCAACGDDATTDGGDGAAGDGGTPDAEVVARCSSDAECDNDQLCDGEEVCVEGACLPGLPVQCDDGIECTIDRCSEALSGCESLPPDLDGDGHVDDTCKDENGDAYGHDCDDTDPLRFPGNIETCDDQDDDCDPDTLGEKDTDGDGFLDAMCCNAGNCGEDCDDLKPSVNPMATEACDRFDNDCNGVVDEGVSVDVFVDGDRDGHGDADADAEKRCPGSVGFALEQDDCDDADPEVFLGQFEICDAKDNNCDGLADEIHQDAPWFLDLDQDGFGDPASTPIFSCERVAGRVLSHNDCRDDAPAIHPAADEACDGVDNDCNGLKDFGIGVNDFEDDDDDDLADDACGAGAPDCNDLNASTGAGLDEICDLVDNDCDDKIDEQTAQTVWYLDRDGDGWGVNLGSALARCEPIPGRASNLGDCRDDLNAVHPGAAESCDGTDEDCDGDSDEGTDYLCSLPNAIAGCNFGACDVLACFAGYSSADGEDANGCEASVPLTGFVPPRSCATNDDCDDFNYCTGREVCIAGNCYYGTPQVCSGPAVLQGSHSIESSVHIQQLAGIETITGDLWVSGTDALQSLVGLSGLKVIGGDLVIENCDNLLSLTGLSGLTSVGGQIRIINNQDLGTPNLPALVTAGSILISGNADLVDVGGFGNLATVYGELRIDYNPDLTSISGFGALRSAGSFAIEENPLLATMGGFGALEHVLTDLHIHGNAHTAIAFPALTTVNGYLDLTGEAPGVDPGHNLTTTSVSLPALDYVGMHLFIRGLWNLTSLELGKLDKVGGHLYLTTLNALVTLSLPELTGIGGLEVGENSSLTSLSLPKLTDVSTDMVGGAPQGLADGDLWIYNNVLTSLSLPDLQTVDGDMFVESAYGIGVNDTTLTSISAPKLNTIGGSLSLTYLDALTSLGMGALATIGSSFSVYGCATLTSIQLPQLATIGLSLAVGSNGGLTTIAGLGLRDQSSVLQLQLDSPSAWLEIYSNPLLCTTEVNAFVAELVTNGYVGSGPYVSGNNDACQ